MADEEVGIKFYSLPDHVQASLIRSADHLEGALIAAKQVAYGCLIATGLCVALAFGMLYVFYVGVVRR